MTGLPSVRIIEMGKVENYLLNRDHPTGRDKAAFFASFGFVSMDGQRLAVALDRHGASRPVVRTTQSEFGQKYEVRCAIETPDRRDPCIVTIWFQPDGEASCRLITAYPSRA